MITDWVSSTHPSVDDLLAGRPAAIAHAADCASCRAVVALTAPVTAAAGTDGDLRELPPIDRALYRDWRALDDRVGAMGRTYRAHDRRLGRDVAIKQVGELPGSPGLRDALRRRFEHEARLTARLQHPAIVGVYEAGRFADGEPFYAMPLVRGASLDDELARRPTLADRLALLPHLTAVCEAIAYAHGEGVVHRDLKPHNVMIGPFGETVVIDWGLARALAEDDAADDERARLAALAEPADGLTRAGAGTAPYMAPEQARGQPPTMAMDVYALGAILYHLLAGVPPYGRDTAHARAALLAGPPPPLTDLAPEAPAELVDIAARAMARDPGARFASVRELADELRRFQTGQLLRTRHYTLAERARRFVRRHRTPLAIGALAVAVIAIVAIVADRRLAGARARRDVLTYTAARDRCEGANVTCDGVIPGVCYAPRELCDGIDQDRDGQHDEGACCEATAERSDGLDNDCDGAIDNGCGCTALAPAADGPVVVAADHRTLTITVPKQWGFSTVRYRCPLAPGRWYWEVVFNGKGYAACIGISTDQVPMFIDEHLANIGPGGCQSIGGIFFPGYRTYKAYFEPGDVISVLFDAQRGELRLWVNGVDSGPAPGLHLGHTFHPTVFLNGGCDQVTMNFGPRFQYAPPPGYSPLP
jgi:hypothetical protein